MSLTNYSTQTEPDPEPDTDALETFVRCAHRHACERARDHCLGAGAYPGWQDDMVRGLACDACECFEDEEE